MSDYVSGCQCDDSAGDCTYLADEDLDDVCIECSMGNHEGHMADEDDEDG